jgi:ubiquinone/menaquinone biosynthesis C-methylase UbiE
MSVLDFGCGPGGFSIAAARIVGPEGHVYALDVNPRALDAVRRAAGRAGLDNLSCLPAEELKTFPERCIDVVLLYDVLHDIPDPGPALAGLHRVIKPDGILSVSDHHLDEARILAAVGSAGTFDLASRPVRPWNLYGFRAVRHP